MGAPAVLVAVETRQQNIFISIHLAKPQCLLCVITDHKVAEDQLLHLRAFVLEEKEYESQCVYQINCKMFGSCLPSGHCYSTQMLKGPVVISSGTQKSLYFQDKHNKNTLKTLYVPGMCFNLYSYKINHTHRRGKEQWDPTNI